MRGVKVYDKSELKEWHQKIRGKPKPLGYDILSVGPKQNFTDRFVMEGLQEGWLSISDQEIRIRSSKGDVVVFTIGRYPGLYCCHCGANLDEAMAREHVAKHSEASPDPFNPSGYRKDNFYATVRVVPEKRKGWLGRLLGG